MNPAVANSFFEIFGFPITDSIIGILLLDLIIIALIALIRLNMKPISQVPSRLQIAFELFYESVSNFMGDVAGDEKISKKIMPMVFTLFTYIFFSNILLVIPILEALKAGDENPLIRIPTTDLGIVVGISVVVVLHTHVLAVAKRGFFHHIHSFVPVVDLVKTLFTQPKQFFIKLIETAVSMMDIISEMSKILSLSMRLFGNMLSGQIISGMVFGLFGLLLPVPLILYGLFTGLLQALVFSALSASYYAGFLSEE